MGKITPIGIIAAVCLSWSGLCNAFSYFKIIGVPTYVPSGSSVVLAIPGVRNVSTVQRSTLSVELWALQWPMKGLINQGYKLARAYFGAVEPGGTMLNLNSGPIYYSHPPDGRWYYALLITDTADGKIVVSDFYNFPNPVECWNYRCSEVPQATLTVAIDGDGLVTSSPVGISCPPTCTTQLDRGTTITLFAHPAGTQGFGGWIGACTGTSTCQIALTSAHEVTASFVPSEESAICPTPGLWVVDAEQDGKPGRGFSIEEQGGSIVFTVFAYDPYGQPMFYQAAGVGGGTTFIGDLTYYSGGTGFGGPRRAAKVAGSAGSVAIEFISRNRGTVTFPKETPKAISKFAWSSKANANSPSPGLWAIDSEQTGQPGRGFTIEVQGDTLVFTLFAYDENGKARFFQAVGQLHDNTFSAPLNAYRGGMSFGQSQHSANLATSAGQVTLQFSDPHRGTITLPGEASTAISKFNWGPACDNQD